jgi:predicted membrane GTPase involved in stress response
MIEFIAEDELVEITPKIYGCVRWSLTITNARKMPD